MAAFGYRGVLGRRIVFSQFSDGGFDGGSNFFRKKMRQTNGLQRRKPSYGSEGCCNPMISRAGWQDRPGLPSGAFPPHQGLRQGGIPIKVGNDTIGAIGASGAPGGDKDEACAAAGLAKISDRLN
jgi:Haem-degrading